RASWRDREKCRKACFKVLPVADYLRLDKSKEDPFANVNYIVRFENLADDFRTVCAALDISPTTLPRYNRSKREHYSKYYDDELRELVRARFAAEIERFGYTFEHITEIQFSKRDVFAVRRAKPFGYLNPRRDHALVTILRYDAPAGAFSKNR